ncbi:MAG: antibiotic biosynthesis monooxygenase [Planctomycetales bacterium]|nr:antibiotic biosynthesis monooxygenase [Planctomycetales bacterium]
MIDVVATIRVVPGGLAEFLAAFQANCPAVLAEDGCIEYYPAVDVATNIDAQSSDAHVVTILEKWRDLPALEKHLEAPHMVKFREEAGHLIDQLSLKILTKA